MNKDLAEEVADCIDRMIACSERGEDGYMIDESGFYRAKRRLVDILTLTGN